jgi:hypothetical protein
MQYTVVITCIKEVPKKGASSVIEALFYLTTTAGHFLSAHSTYKPSMHSEQSFRQM